MLIGGVILVFELTGKLVLRKTLQVHKHLLGVFLLYCAATIILRIRHQDMKHFDGIYRAEKIHAGTSSGTIPASRVNIQAVPWQAL